MEGLSLLNSCLQYDPKDRISWQDLINHSYIKFDSNSPQKAETDELFLSYMPETGDFQQENAAENRHAAVLVNPHKWMQENTEQVV